MAVTLNNSSNSGAKPGTATFSFSHTINAGSNQLLIVHITSIAGSPITISSVAWNTSENFTQVPNARQVDSNGFNGAVSDLWYLKAPTSGTHTIAVTLSGAADSIAGAISCDGVDQTTPLGTAVRNQCDAGKTTQPSLTVTSASGELILAGAAHNTSSTDGITFTSVANQTERWNANVSVGGGDGAGATALGAASVTLNWSVADSSSNRSWSASAVAIKIAATGGGGGGSASGFIFQSRIISAAPNNIFGSFIKAA